MPARPRRVRLPIILAVALGLAVVAVTAVLTWPRDDSDSSSVPAWASTATPWGLRSRTSSTYDKATIDACRYAQQVHEDVSQTKDAETVPAIGMQAHQSATVSDEAALRDLAAKYDQAATDTKLGRLEAVNAALKIFDWCQNHGLTS
ncbi:hypothetical protein ABT299_30280 [Spirillospora sp. NPDC000708]